MTDIYFFHCPLPPLPPPPPPPLPHTYLLDLITDQNRLMLSMIDILYSYCFEFRVTEGDFNVVSAWTIAKLSPTLSWFDVY
jgi:protein SHQ1